MAYSRKYKKIQKKRKNHKKTKTSKKRGGGCGCSKLSGGKGKTSGGSQYLNQLSPQTYYTYNDSTQDPNNQQVSTRMTDVTEVRSVGGGSKKQKLKQRGGLALTDFMNSFTSSPNLVMNSTVGSNVTEPPGFLQNVLSVNQPDVNTKIPFVPPGIKYYV